MQDPDLLQPLWRYPLRWATMAGARDRWSYLNPAQRQSRRTAWPRWRRAVLPVGLTLYGAGIVAGAFFNPPIAVGVLWYLAVGVCAAIGFRGWLKDGRDQDKRLHEQRTRAGSPRS